MQFIGAYHFHPQWTRPELQSAACICLPDLTCVLNLAVSLCPGPWRLPFQLPADSSGLASFATAPISLRRHHYGNPGSCGISCSVVTVRVANGAGGGRQPLLPAGLHQRRILLGERSDLNYRVM